MSHERDDEKRTITLLLDQARDGDSTATEQVWNQLYAEIHRIARGFSAREGASPTLQPSMLVNEAFLRIFGGTIPDWNDRKHFINTVALSMSRFLKDRARARNADKRGGGRKPIPLTIAAGEIADYQTANSMPATDAFKALEALEAEAPDAAEVVRLRFILGLNVEQTAEIIGCSPKTVKNKWRYGQAWMRKHLSEQSDETDPGDSDRAKHD